MGRSVVVAIDPELGTSYTLKRWHSEKVETEPEEGGWTHSRIELRAINREFKPIELVDDARASVIAEFIATV